MLRRRVLNGAGRRERYQRSMFALALSMGAVVACAVTPPDERGGEGGFAGSAPGGSPGSGGGAGLAGASVGGAGTSGVSGASGTAPGTGGSNVSGAGGSFAGAAGGGALGGGTTGGSAGSGGSDAGGAGAGGTGGTAGAPSGGTGGGASGSGGTAGDRCDVAVYNASDPPAIVPVSGSLGTHDPVIMEANNRFYLFHTGGGMGLGAKTSTDFTTWANASAPLSPNPSWVSSQVPGVSNLWAPDISYFGGQYHLYYSASTFGQNRSCIGHATRAALDTGSWTDHGQVICSNVGTNDNWNAIDPNVIIDEAGAAHLSFGSFWSGIKMIHLDSTGARMGSELVSLANRPQNGGALEAPFIVRRCGYYYLFVSWDRCCQGSDSTYNIRVGRSTSVTGPYADKNGTAMAQGGGTLLVQGDTRWRGPGHNAIVFRGNAAYNVYHAYDANGNGRVTLRISEIAWDAEGWPISAGP